MKKFLLSQRKVVRVGLRILLPLVLLSVGVIGFFSLSALKPELQPTEEEPPAYLIAVKTAEKRQVTFELHSQGTVRPKTTTSLVSEVAGHITDISASFVPGGFFDADERLIRVDPRNYEIALKRAELSLARARVRVDTERALAGYAREDWEEFVASSVSTNSPSELTLRRPQLAEALAELALAEAELRKSQDDLARTNVAAPYQGLVLETSVDVGQYVNVGTPIARTASVAFAEIRLPISLNDMQFITLPGREGTSTVPVQLRSTLGGEVIHWDATIVRTEGIIDTQSRVIHAVAEVVDPYDFAGSGKELLRFGTFVHATIQGDDAGELFVIPRHAIYRGSQVWVVNTDDTIEPRNVSVVRFDDESAYIESGLQNGEVYSITPIDRPLPGMKVRINGQ